MVYKVIGLMSGSSLDGLDIVFAEIHVNGGNWSFDIVEADCYAYNEEWLQKLKGATALNAMDYQQLHADYGHYIGQQVNRFINEKNLHYKVALVASHGHTTFHVPSKKMTAQLGDGAAIAAETGLPVVSDLRALDVAFGGQGAPIVPIGEKLLLKDYELFLNLGGIANISFKKGDGYIAYDVCPANRVMNMLAAKEGKDYDSDGAMAETGKVDEDLLKQLNALGYYAQPYPKSLPNSFGIEEVFPLIEKKKLSTVDALRTYIEHIVSQIKAAVAKEGMEGKLLVTGGGAFNAFLIERLKVELAQLRINVIVPDANLVMYKEALIMGLIGVLRWRQEYTVLSSVTGAARESIGGAVWIGQEA